MPVPESGSRQMPVLGLIPNWAASALTLLTREPSLVAGIYGPQDRKELEQLLCGLSGAA